jgi:hypothetical protein
MAVQEEVAATRGAPTEVLAAVDKGDKGEARLITIWSRPTAVEVVEEATAVEEVVQVSFKQQHKV